MVSLSVLMPVRNGAQTLVAALDSTLRALPKTGELIVLDDGSTDCTGDILRSRNDPRLRLFRGETSIGVAAGLNFLLERASGHLIGRMDADDISLPWRFTNWYLHGLEDTDVLFGSVLNFGDSISAFKPMIPYALEPTTMAFALLLENCVAHSTMVCRSETVRRYGGYRQVEAEDYDLWLRMIAAGSSISRSAVPTVLYRRHSNQVSGSAAWREGALSSPAWRESFDAACATVLGRRYDLEVRDARAQIFADIEDQTVRDRRGHRQSRLELWKMRRLLR